MHCAIIMDGNGRWAQARGLPRVEGHRRGAEAVRRTIEAAPELGITNLTLYAFSSDNWKRPQAEIETLMSLFALHLESEAARCAEKGVRILVIGRRDRLAPSLVRKIAEAEQRTRHCTGLCLRIAVDYSSRDAMLSAAAACAGHGLTREAFAAALPAPDVDLLIRTAGEQRLSDFLLWECAYAEFFFCPRMWPDFDASDLRQAVNAFHSRQRRFGALPAATHAIPGVVPVVAPGSAGGQLPAERS
jgi:undecaprenyl diphosphate synthase